MPFKISRLLMLDVLFLFLSVPAAFYLSAKFDLLVQHPYLIFAAAVVYTGMGYALMPLFKVRTKVWAYTTIQDVLAVVGALLLSSTLWSLSLLLVQKTLVFPRPLPILAFMCSTLFLCGARIFVRFFFEKNRTHEHASLSKIPVYLVGSLDACDKTIVSFKSPVYAHYFPVGIIEHHRKNVGRVVRNVPVIGSIQDLEGVLAQIPNLQHKPLFAIFVNGPLEHHYESSLFTSFTSAGVSAIFLPALSKNLTGPKKESQIDYASLLRRGSFETHPDHNISLIEGKKILITGAGGSIGSEVVRKVCLYKPREIVLLDNSEYLLYLIDFEIATRFPEIKKTSILADVREKEVMTATFKKHRPHLVFHAAAIKHVPLSEENPEYAFLVNVLGTKNVLEAAQAHGVELMTLISTDKAVNPTSIMGATKQIAESLARAMAEQGSGKTRFLTVRFGNVLGSNGSVVPLFERQIEEGGPITLTHKDIVRFFMTIGEAVDLVLESSFLCMQQEFLTTNGIFVLNMGEPMRIRELAEQLIMLKGGVPYETIQIVYTGLRPGEKLYEELFDDSEEMAKTSHGWLTIAVPKEKESLSELEQGIQGILGSVHKGDRRQVLALIQKLALNFQESL